MLVVARSCHCQEVCWPGPELLRRSRLTARQAFGNMYDVSEPFVDCKTTHSRSGSMSGYVEGITARQLRQRTLLPAHRTAMHATDSETEVRGNNKLCRGLCGRYRLSATLERVTSAYRTGIT